MRTIPLLLAFAALGGCTTFDAVEMRLPNALASRSEMTPMLGIGGGTHGRFTVGPYRGGFERSERRLEVFDIFERNAGHSEFVIEGPAISSTIEARCRMREKILDLDFAEFKSKPMTYRCDFSADGMSIPARFELQEIREGLGGMLSERARRGEIALGGETLGIRSVHGLEGSSFQLASPIGYVFEKDGKPVGAVELNGSPRLFVHPELDAGAKRTLTIAAVTLAVFWDPANSDLDHD